MYNIPKNKHIFIYVMKGLTEFKKYHTNISMEMFWFAGHMSERLEHFQLELRKLQLLQLSWFLVAASTAVLYPPVHGLCDQSV